MVKFIKASNPKEQGPYVIIEDWDFDPKKHEEYDPPPQAEKPVAPAIEEKPEGDEFDAMTDNQLREFTGKSGRTAGRPASRETLLSQARAMKALDAPA